jgi:uncharacterized protein
MTKDLLIIFYRNPDPGKVKTRLAATMGDEKALAIYLSLVKGTRAITDDLPVDKVVYYSDHIEPDDNWDNLKYKKELQHGDDLGVRMQNAFSSAFQSGYVHVCIIGTDCYGLTSEIILKAFEFLDEGDAIIGPAKDGGYYLLGLNKLYPPLFINKGWGSYTVLDDTLQDFQKLELQYGQLPVLTDVDEEADLPPRFQY